MSCDIRPTPNQEEPPPESFEIRSWHFNWNPFRPKQCLGGPVYIGWWAKVKPCYGYFLPSPQWLERWSSEQSARQIEIKKSMGVPIRERR